GPGRCRAQCPSLCRRHAPSPAAGAARLLPRPSRPLPHGGGRRRAVRGPSANRRRQGRHRLARLPRLRLCGRHRLGGARTDEAARLAGIRRRRRMNADAFEPIVLGTADLGGAARLVEGAGWNQVADDWRIFLDLGRVIGLRAPDGGLAATAAVLPYADGGFGWISMVLVGAGWQRRGLATGLLRTCIETLQAQGLACGLDATPAGRTVYQ